jgi:FxsC-like protein
MPYLLTPDEQAAYDLLSKSNEPQLDDLCVKFGIAIDAIPPNSPLATRYRHVWDIVKKQGGAGLAILEERVREQQNRPEVAYGLYVSRANADPDEALSRSFFQNLTLKLQRKSVSPAADIRYLDTMNVQEPDVWWPWSLRAMQKSRVLICLYSKEYFSTPYCGRIWGAFLGRLREYFGNCPPLIVPLLWGPPSENPNILPRVARAIEFAHEDFGTEYCEKGLRFIQRWSTRDDYKAIYDTFLEKLTNKIVELVEKYPLPQETEIPLLKDIPNAFKEFTEEDQVSDESDADYAKFVFMAARREEIRGLRTPASYGADSKQWMPYHPHSKEHVEWTTQKATADAGKSHDVIRLDENFLTNLQSADSKKNIIIILVDPWTIQLGGDYSTYAKRYDDAELPSSRLLVCWNTEDGETKRQTRYLQETLQKAFERKMRMRRADSFQGNVESIDQLRKELAKALLSARRQIVDEAEGPRVAEGERFVRPFYTVESADHPNVEVRRAEDGRFPHVKQPVLEGPQGGMET